MRNHVSDGNRVTIPAPAAVVSGAGVLAGSLFGVAITDAASGAPVTLALRGIFDLPKATGQAWTVGQLLYWSGTNVTNVASTNKIIGCAAQAQASGDTTGRVLLNAGVVN